MKKAILLIVIICATTFTYAQKIQLKKGVILKDDQPIGKLEGEGSTKKTDIKISSLADLPLINITSTKVEYPAVFYPSLFYYTITFLQQNKVVNFIPKQAFSSEKKLMQYLTETIGDNFLSVEGLNQEVVEKFIAEKDETQKIAQDTTYNIGLIKAEQVKLAEPCISRSLKGSINIVELNKETITRNWAETITNYDVFQDDVLIGKLSKYYRGDPSVSGSFAGQSPSVEYTVMRSVTPFMFHDKQFEFIKLAKVSSSLSTPNIYAQCERAWSKDLKTSNIFSAEYDIVSWLISKGCL